MTARRSRTSRQAPPRTPSGQPVLESPAAASPVAEAELADAIAANEPVHDVTRLDQLWLFLLALIPFAAATVWFAQHH